MIMMMKKKKKKSHHHHSKNRKRRLCGIVLVSFFILYVFINAWLYCHTTDTTSQSISTPISSSSKIWSSSSSSSQQRQASFLISVPPPMTCRRGWIVDVPYWSSMWRNNNGGNHHDPNSTNSTTYTSHSDWPQRRAHFFGPPEHTTTLYPLISMPPNFTKAYDTARGPQRIDRNEAPAEQHLIHLVYAAALFQYFDFEIVTDASQFARQSHSSMTDEDCIYMYWGSLGAFRKREHFEKITGQTLEGDYVSQVLDWWRRQPWIAEGGRNLIVVESFPKKWKYEPWHSTQAQILLSEPLMIPSSMQSSPSISTTFSSPLTVQYIPYNLPRVPSWPTSSSSSNHKQQQQKKNRSLLVFFKGGCRPPLPPTSKRVPPPVGQVLRHFVVQDAAHWPYDPPPPVEKKPTLWWKRIRYWLGHYVFQPRPPPRQARPPLPPPYQDANRSLHLGCENGVLEQPESNKGAMIIPQHQVYLERLQDSLFCLVIQGDTPSSLRAAEVVAHGCIPVLLGPPFHTIFLPQLFGWYPSNSNHNTTTATNSKNSSSSSSSPPPMAVWICIQDHQRWWRGEAGIDGDYCHSVRHRMTAVVPQLNDVYNVLGDLVRHHPTQVANLQRGVAYAQRLLRWPRLGEEQVDDKRDGDNVMGQGEEDKYKSRAFDTPLYATQLFRQMLPRHLWKNV